MPTHIHSSPTTERRILDGLRRARGATRRARYDDRPTRAGHAITGDVNAGPHA